MKDFYDLRAILSIALAKDLRHPINKAIAAKALFAVTGDPDEARALLREAHVPVATRTAIIKLWLGHTRWRSTQGEAVAEAHDE